MTKYYFLLLFLLSIISCTTKEAKTKKLDFGQFSLTVPRNWEKLEEKGFDSYVGTILIDSVDFLHFDLGLYSNDLEEFLKEPTDSTMGWTIYPPLSNLGNNRNSKAYFDTVDGIRCKIVLPIDPGKGITGVYFDSLRNIKGSKISFEMSGDNLKYANQRLTLEAFKTIKFK